MATKKGLCKRGHDMVGANLIVTAAGRRYCRKCNNTRKARWAERKRLAARLARYGAPIALYDRLLVFQERVCWFCKEDLPLVIDHDHKTGHIRGLLCDNCNLILGVVEGNLPNLLAMLEYIEQGGLVETTVVVM